MSEKSTKAAPERISVREANQGFSRLIARVEEGQSFVVTKNDKEVARIEPIATDASVVEARRKAAWERLERVMNAGYRSEDGWTFKGRRDELHDRSV